MHRNYFPICPVDGPFEPPAPFSHFSTGAVPAKCKNCAMLFEGECTRFMDVVGHYLHLDHGPCGVNGPTDPVVYQDAFVTAKVEIPRKCSTCSFLKLNSIRGFICSKDKDKWGDFPRGLDWGTWEPGCYLELPVPRVTTRQMATHAKNADEMAFIIEHRRVNPGLSLELARQDYMYFRSTIEKAARRKNQG